MADWDDDSPQLDKNLIDIRASLERDAEKRPAPTVALAKAWHTTIMDGLTVPDPVYVGRFRGEAGLESCRVLICGVFGAPAGDVASELARFEATLRTGISMLDRHYPAGADLDKDGLAAAIDLAAWAHAEWVRIHPFRNGNGRTARIWANWILMRYGLRLVIRLRPRPESGYEAACASAMQGDWRPTARLFRAMVRDATAPPT